METIEIKGSSFIVVKCDDREIWASQAYDTFEEAWDAMHQDWLKCHDPEYPDEDEGECNPGNPSAWLNRACDGPDADWTIVHIVKGV